MRRNTRVPEHEMSSQPTLSYLVAANDTYEDHSELSHAIIVLTPERVEQMLERIREAEEKSRQDHQFSKIAYREWGNATFHARPEDYYDTLSEEDHPHHADYLMLEEVRSYGVGQLFAVSVVTDAPKLRTDCEEMVVREDSISWQANYRNDRAVITTGELWLEDLLVARLYYAAGKEWGTHFTELAQQAPELAISLLEKGLVIPGLAPIDVRSRVSPDVFASLLEQAESQHRERLIVTLGKLQSRDGQGVGDLPHGRLQVSHLNENDIEGEG